MDFLITWITLTWKLQATWTGQPNQFFDALLKCKFLTVADEGLPILHDWQFINRMRRVPKSAQTKAKDFAILARHNRDMHIKG